MLKHPMRVAPHIIPRSLTDFEDVLHALSEKMQENKDLEKYVETMLWHFLDTEFLTDELISLPNNVPNLPKIKSAHYYQIYLLLFRFLVVSVYYEEIKKLFSDHTITLLGANKPRGGLDAIALAKSIINILQGLSEIEKNLSSDYFMFLSAYQMMQSIEQNSFKDEEDILILSLYQYVMKPCKKLIQKMTETWLKYNEEFSEQCRRLKQILLTVSMSLEDYFTSNAPQYLTYKNSLINKKNNLQNLQLQIIEKEISCTALTISDIAFYLKQYADEIKKSGPDYLKNPGDLIKIKIAFSVSMELLLNQINIVTASEKASKLWLYFDLTIDFFKKIFDCGQSQYISWRALILLVNICGKITHQLQSSPTAFKSEIIEKKNFLQNYCSKALIIANLMAIKKKGALDSAKIPEYQKFTNEQKKKYLAFNEELMKLTQTITASVNQFKSLLDGIQAANERKKNDHKELEHAQLEWDKNFSNYIEQLEGNSKKTKGNNENKKTKFRNELKAQEKKREGILEIAKIRLEEIDMAPAEVPIEDLITTQQTDGANTSRSVDYNNQALPDKAKQQELKINKLLGEAKRKLEGIKFNSLNFFECVNLGVSLVTQAKEVFTALQESLHDADLVKAKENGFHNVYFQRIIKLKLSINHFFDNVVEQEANLYQEMIAKRNKIRDATIAKYGKDAWYKTGEFSFEKISNAAKVLAIQNYKVKKLANLQQEFTKKTINLSMHHLEAPFWPEIKKLWVASVLDAYSILSSLSSEAIGEKEKKEHTGYRAALEIHGLFKDRARTLEDLEFEVNKQFANSELTKRV